MKRIPTFAIWLSLTLQAFAGFGYYSPVTVNSGQVPSAQTDFPQLILKTDARLKTVANGGYVQDSLGRDIRPYTDSGGAPGSAITGYELVYYNGTTGTLEMWVKRSSLDVGTVTQMTYGDASLTTDDSSSTTWDSNFKGVYHLKDGTTLSVNSATGSNNGTNNGATATTGQIDGGAAFVRASSQSINLAHPSDWDMGSGDYTFESWIKTSDISVRGTIFGKDVSGGRQFNLATCVTSGTGGLEWFHLNGNSSFWYGKSTNDQISNNTWFHVAVTRSSSTIAIYVNAVSQSTSSLGGTTLGTMNATTTDCYIGQRTFSGANDFWPGSMDEARISKGIARSANWITTEYNNQSAPDTFQTWGTQVAVSTANTTNWFMFFPQ